MIVPMRVLSLLTIVALGGCTKTSSEDFHSPASKDPRVPLSESTAGEALTREKTQNTHLRESRAHMSSGEEYRREKYKALERADKLRKEGVGASPGIPLPNFVSGPGVPRPVGINLYQQREYYPGYLMCLYDVEERRYDPDNEAGWCRAALLQIRGEGPGRFPPFKWVAVIIRNRVDQRLVGYQQAHKAGAIFDLAKVFNPAVDPEQLVSHVKIDRHPLEYDSTRPTPGEQDRWLIVEQRLGK